ncbi:MAG: hypothetical protein M0000_11105 [Actinomycetota bacterium]|nr:hypothetical protein [Actinomycetota bacterium]
MIRKAISLLALAAAIGWVLHVGGPAGAIAPLEHFCLHVYTTVHAIWIHAGAKVPTAHNVTPKG